MMARLPLTGTCLRSLSLAGALALGGVVILAPTAQAGMIDGSLNNAHVLDHGNLLGVMVNSKLSDDSNNNANSRADGQSNNAAALRAAHTRSAAAPASSCTLTLHADDPDGASGSTTVALPDGTAQSEVDVPDNNPAVRYAVGDTDHLTGEIVCTDTATGEVIDALDVSSDLVAS
jgi:hypothetical protein